MRELPVWFPLVHPVAMAFGAAVTITITMRRDLKEIGHLKGFVIASFGLFAIIVMMFYFAFFYGGVQ